MCGDCSEISIWQIFLEVNDELLIFNRYNLFYFNFTLNISFSAETFSENAQKGRKMFLPRSSSTPGRRQPNQERCEGILKISS